MWWNGITAKPSNVYLRILITNCFEMFYYIGQKQDTEACGELEMAGAPATQAGNAFMLSLQRERKKVN